MRTKDCCVKNPNADVIAKASVLTARIEEMDAMLQRLRERNEACRSLETRLQREVALQGNLKHKSPTALGTALNQRDNKIQLLQKQLNLEGFLQRKLKIRLNNLVTHVTNYISSVEELHQFLYARDAGIYDSEEARMLSLNEETKRNTLANLCQGSLDIPTDAVLTPRKTMAKSRIRYLARPRIVGETSHRVTNPPPNNTMEGESGHTKACSTGDTGTGYIVKHRTHNSEVVGPNSRLSDESNPTPNTLTDAKPVDEAEIDPSYCSSTGHNKTSNSRISSCKETATNETTNDTLRTPISPPPPTSTDILTSLVGGLQTPVLPDMPPAISIVPVTPVNPSITPVPPPLTPVPPHIPSINSTPPINQCEQRRKDHSITLPTVPPHVLTKPLPYTPSNVPYDTLPPVSNLCTVPNTPILAPPLSSHLYQSHQPSVEPALSDLKCYISDHSVTDADVYKNSSCESSMIGRIGRMGGGGSHEFESKLVGITCRLADRVGTDLDDHSKGILTKAKQLLNDSSYGDFSNNNEDHKDGGYVYKEASTSISEYIALVNKHRYDADPFPSSLPTSTSTSADIPDYSPFPQVNMKKLKQDHKLRMHRKSCADLRKLVAREFATFSTKLKWAKCLNPQNAISTSQARTYTLWNHRGGTVCVKNTAKKFTKYVTRSNLKIIIHFSGETNIVYSDKSEHRLLGDGTFIVSKPDGSTYTRHTDGSIDVRVATA